MRYLGDGIVLPNRVQRVYLGATGYPELLL